MHKIFVTMNVQALTPVGDEEPEQYSVYLITINCIKSVVPENENSHSMTCRDALDDQQ